MEKLNLSNLNKTWIFDLDGTILKHGGHLIEEQDTFLDGAREFLDSIDKDDMIIFLTARTYDEQEATYDFLKKNNIRYNHIIFHAPHGERILLNDIKPSGLKTAYAINTPRDKFPEIYIKKML